MPQVIHREQRIAKQHRVVPAQAGVLQSKASDRRPAVLPDRPIDILAATAEWFDDPEEGPFLRVSVRSDPYPDVPGEECSITIPIAEHGGPHLDAVYYQIVPQRSPCHGGLFEGLSGSRGYLVR